MPKKREVRVILEDILEEIDRINRFVASTNSLNDFVNNELVYYAVLKALENT